MTKILRGKVAAVVVIIKCLCTRMKSLTGLAPFLVPCTRNVTGACNGTLVEVQVRAN